MVQQQLVKKFTDDNLYDFMEFRKKKPFFRNRMKVTLGYPINTTYYMIKNLVFMDKQILALRAEEEPKTIVLVEAKIEDGELIQISRLPDEFLNNISRMLSGNADVLSI